MEAQIREWKNVWALTGCLKGVSTLGKMKVAAKNKNEGNDILGLFYSHFIQFYLDWQTYPAQHW